MLPGGVPADQADTELARAEITAGGDTGRASVRGVLVGLDDRLGTDQPAHRDLVAEEADILEDRQGLGAAELGDEVEDLPLLGGQRVGGGRGLDLDLVVREVIERDPDGPGRGGGRYRGRDAISPGGSARFRSRSPATAGPVSGRLAPCGPSMPGVWF